MRVKPTYEELERRVLELEQAEFLRKSGGSANGYTSELLSIFFKNSPVYAFLKEISNNVSRVLYVSDNYVDMTGIPASRMIGKTMKELFPGEFAEKITRDDIDVVSCGKNLKLDEELDGRYYVTYKFPIRFGDRKYLAGYTIDITDRKRVEEDFEQIFTMSLDMLCIADIETATFVKVNPAFTETLGYSRKELLKRPFFDLIHPEDIETTRIVVEEKLGKGAKVIDFENRYRCRDGSYRWLSWVSHPNLKKKVTFAVARDITQWKQNEESLRESEERYRTVLDTINEGIIVQSLSGEILTWNKGAEEIFGIPAKDALGRTSKGIDWPMIHEDGSKYEGENHPSMRTLVTGKPCRNEIMGLYRPSGELRWISVNTNPLYAAKGEKLHAVVISFSDITGFKQAEDALRNSERELQQTLEATTDGIWTWNFKTNTLFFSPNYYKMLGYEPCEFPADFENWLNLVHPDDRESALASAAEYLKTKPDVYENEFRLMTKSGDYRWIRARARVVERNGLGEAVRMIGNHEDFTERKLAVSALIQEKDRFDLAMRSVNDGLYDWNLKTNEIYLSPVWKKLLGYEDDEIKNEFSAWERFTDPEDVKKSWKTLKEVLEGKRERFEMEFRMLHKDGHWVDILSRANVVFDEKGRGIRVVGTHVDISERKRIEKSLQQAQKMEAIGILAGGIAHDFNNMLSVLTGNISYALSILKKDDELFEVLSDVMQGTKQARNLTHQLLTFAKGGKPVKKCCDINELIEESAKFVTSGARSICDFKPADDLWAAEVDSGQINQVIGNVVINAVQAMPKGGIIKIKTENIEMEKEGDFQLPAGPYIKISIEDQGIGIREEHISSIFDPYFTTKSKGSGLGLATAYSIVGRHGGNITVYSESGKGTVFNIYLPASPARIPETEGREESMHQGHGRVLVMDDQEPILRMVGRMLNRMGYESESVIDGQSAVEAYKAAYEEGRPFDLVILDLTVPGGMGGAKTIPELLKIDPDVKAVVSSGYSNDPVMANYQDHGFCGVVPKPYTKGYLAELLNKVLK